MTTRIPCVSAASVLRLTLVALAAFFVSIPANAGAVTAELRVLTPDAVLDPGTNYVIDDSITVPTRGDADCFGPPGGSGAQYPFTDPVALGLLASGARATGSLRPLGVSDQFGFGLVICTIGGIEAQTGSFWYLKSNHVEAGVGADQLEVAEGDEVLFYLAPDNFPDPNPVELELIAPARTAGGAPFAVSVIQHACVTDSNPPFATNCQSKPAGGVTVSGGTSAATTASDGTAMITPGSSPRDTLVATRGTDIPSKALRVCVNGELSACPSVRGERFVGSPDADKIVATKGADSIRARGGDDNVRVAGGFADKVDCGPGDDKAIVDAADKVSRDCEKVKTK